MTNQKRDRLGRFAAATGGGAAAGAGAKYGARKTAPKLSDLADKMRYQGHIHMEQDDLRRNLGFEQGKHQGGVSDSRMPQGFVDPETAYRKWTGAAVKVDNARMNLERLGRGSKALVIGGLAGAAAEGVHHHMHGKFAKSQRSDGSYQRAADMSADDRYLHRRSLNAHLLGTHYRKLHRQDRHTMEMGRGASDVYEHAGASTAEHFADHLSEKLRPSTKHKGVHYGESVSGELEHRLDHYINPRLVHGHHVAFHHGPMDESIMAAAVPSHVTTGGKGRVIVNSKHVPGHNLPPMGQPAKTGKGTKLGFRDILNHEIVHATLRGKNPQRWSTSKGQLADHRAIGEEARADKLGVPGKGIYQHLGFPHSDRELHQQAGSSGEPHMDALNHTYNRVRRAIPRNAAHGLRAIAKNGAPMTTPKHTSGRKIAAGSAALAGAGYGTFTASMAPKVRRAIFHDRDNPEHVDIRAASKTMPNHEYFHAPRAGKAGALAANAGMVGLGVASGAGAVNLVRNKRKVNKAFSQQSSLQPKPRSVRRKTALGVGIGTYVGGSKAFGTRAAAGEALDWSQHFAAKFPKAGPALGKVDRVATAAHNLPRGPLLTTGLVGGAALGGAVEHHRATKVAKAYDEHKHRRDLAGRFAAGAGAVGASVGSVAAMQRADDHHRRLRATQGTFQAYRNWQMEGHGEAGQPEASTPHEWLMQEFAVKGEDGRPRLDGLWRNLGSRAAHERSLRNRYSAVAVGSAAVAGAAAHHATRKGSVAKAGNMYFRSIEEGGKLADRAKVAGKKGPLSSTSRDAAFKNGQPRSSGWLKDGDDKVYQLENMTPGGSYKRMPSGQVKPHYKLRWSADGHGNYPKFGAGHGNRIAKGTAEMITKAARRPKVKEKVSRTKQALAHMSITPEQARHATVLGQVGSSAGTVAGSAAGALLGIKGKRVATGMGVGAGVGAAFGGGVGASLGLYSGKHHHDGVLKRAPTDQADSQKWERRTANSLNVVGGAADVMALKTGYKATRQAFKVGKPQMDKAALPLAVSGIAAAGVNAHLINRRKKETTVAKNDYDVEEVFKLSREAKKGAKIGAIANPVSGVLLGNRSPTLAAVQTGTGALGGAAIGGLVHGHRRRKAADAAMAKSYDVDEIFKLSRDAKVGAGVGAGYAGYRTARLAKPLMEAGKAAGATPGRAKVALAAGGLAGATINGAIGAGVGGVVHGMRKPKGAPQA